MQRVQTGLLLAVLALGAAPAAADDVGDAIRAAGGSDFSARAGDAIRVTCRDLGSAGAARTSAQDDLFGRCGDMSLTALNVTGGDTGAQNRYGLTSNEEVYGTLRQFSGEETSSQGRYASEGTQDQFANIGARLNAIRNGTRSSTLAFNFYGVDLAEAARSNQNNAQTPAHGLVGGGAGSADADTGSAWFGTVNYGFGDRDASDNEDEYDADSYGITLGVDYAFNEAFVVGIAAGYNEYQVDFDSNSVSSLVNDVSGGSMDSDGFTVSGFFDYRRGVAYLSGILSVGSTDYDIERIVEVPTSPTAPAQTRLITSDTNSDQISAQIQFGYTFGAGATTFDLYGGVELQDIEIDGFVETDTSPQASLGLAFGDQEIKSTQSLVGGTVRHAISTGRGVIVPYASAEWRHEFKNNSRFVDARYALAVGDVNGDGLSDNFSLPTDDPDENFFDLSAGLSGQFGNGLSLFLQYSAVVGLKDTSANLITFGVRGVF